eukprot:gene14360-16982_t
MVSSAVRDDTELVFVFPPSSQPEARDASERTGENAQQEAGQRVDTLLEEARSAQQQWRQQQQQGPSREGSSAAPGDTWTFVLGDAQGGRLVLRVVGSEVGSLRPNERALASALRYAIYPLHCKTTVDNTHVPPTVSLEHEAFESRHPAPEGPVVNPKGSGRRRRRGDSEGRPWRRSAESKQCARGIHVERVELLEEVLGRLAGPLFVL